VSLIPKQVTATTKIALVAINPGNARLARFDLIAAVRARSSAEPRPLGYLRPGLNRNRDRSAFAGRGRQDLRMPDLSVTATGGFPYIGADGTRPKLVLPSPDRDTIGAAATITARMAS
jgi:Bacterial cellulose synthase subunit